MRNLNNILEGMFADGVHEGSSIKNVREGMFDVDDNITQMTEDLEFKCELSWIKDKNLRENIDDMFSISWYLQSLKNKGWSLSDNESILKIHELIKQSNSKALNTFDSNQIIGYLGYVKELNAGLEKINQITPIIIWCDQHSNFQPYISYKFGKKEIKIFFEADITVQDVDDMKQIKIPGIKGPNIKEHNGSVIVRYDILK